MQDQNPRMNPVPYADLHLLSVLAQTRSFTQTARQCGLSKATVSQRTAELERRVGVPLVRRTTRSVVLTETGLQLVQDTEAAFARIDQSLSQAGDQAGVPRGLVRVTAPVALGRQHVAPLLPPFLRAHPEIRIELELSDRIVNLAQEGFDLAVRHAHAAPDTHVAWVLCDTRSVLVASAAYLRRHGTPDGPADLSGHACLAYLRGGPAPRWVFERKLPRRPLERVVVPVTGPLKVNNSEVLRDAVLAALGLGLLPDFSVQRELAAGRLHPVLPDWIPVGVFGERIFATRAGTAQVPRAVQLLVQHLREGFVGGFA